MANGILLIDCVLNISPLRVAISATLQIVILPKIFMLSDFLLSVILLNTII